MWLSARPSLVLVSSGVEKGNVMAYADRQHGKLTGSWVARVRLAGRKVFKRSFPTKVEAEDYERYVRQNGK
jgi:hypothetical protein